MLLVKKGTFELHTTGRLVKAAEVAELARLDELEESARREGYEKGLHEGRLEISSKKLELAQESVQYMRSMEEKMGELVMKALRKCVDTISDEELIVEQIRKAMKAVVRNQQQITVNVNPDMVPLVKGRIDSITKDFPTVDFVDVVEDPKLSRVACVVETATGVVDADIDVQLEAIERSIKKYFEKS